MDAVELIFQADRVISEYVAKGDFDGGSIVMDSPQIEFGNLGLPHVGQSLGNVNLTDDFGLPANSSEASVVESPSSQPCNALAAR